MVLRKTAWRSLVAIIAVILAMSFGLNNVFAQEADAEDSRLGLGETGQAKDASESTEEPDVTASGTCGTCPWTLDSDGLLTISSGTLASHSEETDWEWDAYRSQIKAVYVSEGVSCGKSLRNMFKKCKLHSFVAENWNTASVEDMGYMFYGCTALGSLDATSWDTSSVSDMSFMFYQCTGLTSLDLSSWDVSSVKSMDSMFYITSTPKLTVLNLSGWDTSSVENMYSMFGNQYNLSTLDISGWDTSSVRNMMRMFKSCGSLESLDISNWKTPALEDMMGMFEGCTSLTSLNLSGWDVSDVYYYGMMFDCCYSLESLDLSGWNTSNVFNTPANMFRSCDSLTSISIGAGYSVNAFPEATSSSGKWYSQSTGQWYTADEILANRLGVADVYTSSDAPIQKDIINSEVQPIANKTYTGSAIKPLPLVTLDGNALNQGSDYTLSYNNNTNVGTATITIVGAGNYTGSKSVTFKISPKTLSGLTLTLSTSTFTYTGKAIKPSVTVAIGSKKLTKDVDYTLKYSKNTNAGTATVTATGKGNYTGSKSATFKIAPVKISSAKLSLAKKAFAYTGKAIKPTVKAKVGSVKLVNGTDFVVSYAKSSKAVGRYKITVKGKGNYSGSASMFYKVVPKGSSILSLKSASGSGKIGFKASWKKQDKQITGYEFRTSLSSDSGYKKPKKIEKSSKFGKSCSGYIFVSPSWKGKRVYVQVRTYKIVKGKQYNSDWSKAKSVVVK